MRSEGLTELYKRELEVYNALGSLERDKYLEEHLAQLIDIKDAEDGTKNSLWTFDVSHKLQSAIILYQNEDETFEESAQRFINDALKLFIKNNENGNEEETT